MFLLGTKLNRDKIYDYLVYKCNAYYTCINTNDEFMNVIRFNINLCSIPKVREIFMK